MVMHETRDDLFDETLLRAVVAEIPDRDAGGWVHFTGDHETDKWMLHDPKFWGEAANGLAVEMNRVGVKWAQGLLGEDLTFSTYGGGYHWTAPGGVLDRHVDFTHHPNGQIRRANMLVYLNDDWTDEGGWLELSNDAGEILERICPEFNRTVLMESNDRSWHGHPVPAERGRLSFAGYLYATEGDRPSHSTVFETVQ